MGTVLRLLTRPAAGIGVFAGQVLRSAHRQDLPSHNNQDPSGEFGDPDLPALRIALLGDSSITAPGVVPLDDCWPRRLARYLEGRYYVEIHSVGVGGSKSRDVLADQVGRALEANPDMAIVSVGANDALRATSVVRFEAEIDAILDRLTAGIPMVGMSGVGDLGTVPRLPDLARAFARVRARAFDSAIRRVVARHPGVVKSRTWGEAWKPFEEMPDVTFAPDQFHASAAGHAMFAAAAIPVVEKLLAEREVSGQPGSRESAM
jgi:lysophospholipase L1-like esterase